MHRIDRGELDLGGGGRAGRIGDKAAEADAVGGGVFELAADAAGRLGQADDHDVVGDAEASAESSQQAPGIEAKQAQQDPGEAGEEAEKGAREVGGSFGRGEAEEILEEDHQGGAEQALAEGIAQDDAREGGVDAVVDFPPIAQGDPDQHGPAQQEGDARGLQVEIVLQPEAGAKPVG